MFSAAGNLQEELGELAVWDFQSGRCLRRWQTRVPLGLSLRPDGRWLDVLTADGVLETWALD